MSTGRERSNANLRPGGRGFDARERREGVLAAQVKAAEEREKTASMHAAAQDNPNEVVRRLFAAAARVAERAYDKASSTGKFDSHLIDVSKEARQLADRCLEIIRAEGELAQADAILAEMDTRTEAIAAVLEESLRPAADPAA